MSKTNNEVGYCKPPKSGQFKPGQSGNPKGRPKGTKNLTTDISEELSEKIQVKENGKVAKISKQRAMIKTLTAKAVKGDVRAISTVLNLIPAAEKAQIYIEQAEKLDQADADILAAFREFTLKELQSGSSLSNGDQS